MSEGKSENVDWKIVVGVVGVAILIGVALVAVGAVLCDMARISTKDAPTGLDAANAVSSLISALGSVGTAWIAYVVFGIARELDSRKSKNSRLLIRQKLWRLLRNSDLLCQCIEEVKLINQGGAQQWTYELNQQALEMGSLREKWGLDAIWEAIEHFDRLDEGTLSKLERAMDQASVIEFALERLSKFQPVTDSTNQEYMLNLELAVGDLAGALTTILGVSPAMFSSFLSQAVDRSAEYERSSDIARIELLKKWALDYFPPMPFN